MEADVKLMNGLAKSRNLISENIKVLLSASYLKCCTLSPTRARPGDGGQITVVGGGCRRDNGRIIFKSTLIAGI